ncbi:MAG: HAMP domain-containing histidine kinase [Proteobacteria bacterium]|nr:HAMP domain-containing histidine kinase [Pseudomonadota bacterium]
MNRLRHLFSSVFIKLLLVCLLAWLLITVAVSVLFIGYRFMVGAPHNHLIVDYINYLVTDLDGQPERAAVIADRLDVGILYQGPEKSWTSGNYPVPDNLCFFKAPGNDRLTFAFGHDVKYIGYQQPSGNYIFAVPDRSPDGWLQSHLHFLALIIVALVFAGTYFLIRRILSPISILHDATQKVGKGDLNYEAKVSCNGELARLADSFNFMVRQVREMVTAKEQLLRDVSHELRSPLTRIKVLLEMVEPPERVEQIRSDIRELEDLIPSILEPSRHFHQLNRLTMEVVDLHDLVAEVIKRQGDRMPDIVLDQSEQPALVKVDRRLFTRVVENLLKNALIHGRPAAGPVKVLVKPGNKCIELIVADSGPGISEHDLPHLMEPFYQADKSRSGENIGFGLGLSLCKTIVEAHGGDLILTSHLGRGTEVLVRLPCCKA